MLKGILKSVLTSLVMAALAKATQTIVRRRRAVAQLAAESPSSPPEPPSE